MAWLCIHVHMYMASHCPVHSLSGRSHAVVAMFSLSEAAAPVYSLYIVCSCTCKAWDAHYMPASHRHNTCWSLSYMSACVPCVGTAWFSMNWSYGYTVQCCCWSHLSLLPKVPQWKLLMKDFSRRKTHRFTPLGPWGYTTSITARQQLVHLCTSHTMLWD